MTAEAIDVLVVAYGAPELLDECLGAVGRSLPVTVVDNSSSPEVRAVSERHGAHYLDPGSNLGFAAGVNVGLGHRAAATGDVLLLNPDAAIDGAGVIGLHRMLHSRPDLAAVAPEQVDPVDGARARVDWPFPTPWGAWAEAVGAGRFRRGDEFMIGSVLLLRSEALAEVGGFDERFFLYAEETDWQRRARDLGWRIALCPDVVATLQLSFIPGLARRGALRAQIEAVRVADACRGGGLGAAMMAWAIGEARRRGCALVQLTSDKSRTSAHRFYERLGFVATHEGMKLAL